MMIYTKIYDAPHVNEREIMRYAGVKTPTEEITLLMNEAVEEASGVLTYKACYGEFSVTVDNGMLDFGFASVHSTALAKNLAECSRVVIFAATVGLGLDRLVARYGVKSPSRALMLQAFGAERIEALCDRFAEDIGASDYKGYSLKPRFSPGYGDLPLEFQREIFSVLDCPKMIGLSLNKSLLMTPTKSVTAIIGIKP